MKMFVAAANGILRSVFWNRTVLGTMGRPFVPQYQSWLSAGAAIRPTMRAADNKRGGAFIEARESGVRPKVVGERWRRAPPSE
jgi:hypothetical protein